MSCLVGSKHCIQPLIVDISTLGDHGLRHLELELVRSKVEALRPEEKPADPHLC